MPKRNITMVHAMCASCEKEFRARRIKRKIWPEDYLLPKGWRILIIGPELPTLEPEEYYAREFFCSKECFEK